MDETIRQLAARRVRCGPDRLMCNMLQILGVALLAGLTSGPIGCAGGDSRQGGWSRPFGGKGSPWTILCVETTSPTGVQEIQQLADTLRHTAGIRANDVIVRAESNYATRLYYGTYYWSTDPGGRREAMPSQMRDDLTVLRQLADPAGRRYFLRAVPVRMPTPDVGNPDWSLNRAKGMYTLQVAVFEPTDEFLEYKEAAAEYCKLLREKGYEAYYYHTDAASLVTVGAFGADAIIKPPADVAQREFIRKGTMVLPVYGKGVLSLQRDELLKYNLHNGGIRYSRSATGDRVPEMSQLVEIPQTDTATP